jgi:hypothetical protein
MGNRQRALDLAGVEYDTCECVRDLPKIEAASLPWNSRKEGVLKSISARNSRAARGVHVDRRALDKPRGDRENLGRTVFRHPDT